MLRLVSWSCSQLIVVGIIAIGCAFAPDLAEKIANETGIGSVLLVRAGIAALGAVAVAAGTTRRVTTIDPDAGTVSVRHMVLFVLPFGTESHPIKDIRKVNLRYQKEDRNEFYELRIIFQDRSEVLIGADTNERKIGELADAVKQATGARIG